MRFFAAIDRVSHEVLTYGQFADFNAVIQHLSSQSSNYDREVRVWEVEPHNLLSDEQLLQVVQQQGRIVALLVPENGTLGAEEAY